MKKDIQGLIKISHYASSNKAYIQGGGGNTSVKIDDCQMAVKASGCKLSDINEFEGYVIVNYRDIRNFFLDTDGSSAEFEDQSSKILKSSVIDKKELKKLRPSVEAGFHSALKKFVIHSHSVYANILCCSEQGKSIAGEIFKDISFLWLPYVDPGAKLTMAVIQGIKSLGEIPDAVFMENHGVIVSSENADEVILIHEKINNYIRNRFDLKGDFPNVLVEEDNRGIINSASNYVAEFFSQNAKNLNMLREKVLYPDQLVYLNNSIFKTDDSKADIYFNGNKLCYRSSEIQAIVNEETLVAYLYVIDMIDILSLSLVCMTYEQQAFILGWESEAYRKSMLK